MAADVLRAGHLVAVVQIVDGVEDRVVVGNVDDLPVREDLLHGLDEDIPFVGAVEVVAHEEAAAQQVLAELGDLLLGQFPVADFDRVEPG